MGEALLTLDKVTLGFAGNTVLQGVDYVVTAGSIASLIGPNGAGKTSLFNCITGFYKPQAGQITFNGVAILPLKPFQVTRTGIARTALSGTVTVATNKKAVQHLTGGTVEAILVKEGDKVKAGDVLVRMNAVQSRANAESSRVQYFAARSAEARLIAERDGK